MSQVSFIIGMMLCWGMWSPNLACGQEMYSVEAGFLEFRSEAPLELILARNTNLRGLLQSDTGDFAIVIDMNAFEGFNSQLQKDHFCEKFMECFRFPKASFRGNLIEQIDFSQPGVHQVRAKGKLVIHGIEQERILRGRLEIGPGGLSIDASFQVPLEDHKITVPRVVNQNIAELIDVSIHLELFPI